MAVAIIELVSRQLVSGVVRMVYAIIYSFLLGYGVSMGSELYLTIDKNSTLNQSDACKLANSATTCISSESQWFNFLMVPIFAMAFCIFLRARLPRWPIMAIVAAFAYVINYALACWAHAPSQILQVAPAFGLGLVGNLLSKFTGKMSFDAVLLGVFYLVPSSLGLKAAIGLFSGGEEVGTQGAGFALAMIESSIGMFLKKYCNNRLLIYNFRYHTGSIPCHINCIPQRNSTYTTYEFIIYHPFFYIPQLKTLILLCLSYFYLRINNVNVIMGNAVIFFDAVETL